MKIILWLIQAYIQAHIDAHTKTHIEVHNHIVCTNLVAKFAEITSSPKEGSKVSS